MCFVPEKQTGQFGEVVRVAGTNPVPIRCRDKKLSVVIKDGVAVIGGYHYRVAATVGDSVIISSGEG